MTILPVKPHNQKKEDSQFQENPSRDPRSARQRPRRHHNSESPLNQTDYPYWNVSYNAPPIDEPNYEDLAPSHNSPVSDLQAIHPQVLSESASTSAEIPWRIPSPLDTVEPVSCDETAYDQTSQSWRQPPSTSDIENKVVKTSKKPDKKVCVKRRQRRTSPYSKIRQKHTRPKLIAHSHKPEVASKPALVKTVNCKKIPANNTNNTTKSDKRVFNGESLSASSQQAQATTGEERNISTYKSAENKEVNEEKHINDVNENETKHNSDDEYDPIRLRGVRENVDFNELETTFEAKLKEKRGYIIKPMNEDGACLFRAVADQVYGDQNMHDVIRKNCMDYMMKNADFFKNYITEDFNAYISRKRKNNTYGNHLEIQAMAELYNRPFEVYQYSIEPINTFHSEHNTDNIPVRLSYHQNSHYNSIVDPYKATIGVGLGLPSFKPGSADENLLNRAVNASEQQLLEEQMFQDKVQATDWESTEEAVLKHVAMQSYKQYVESNIPIPKNNENKPCNSSDSAANNEITTTAIVESKLISSTDNKDYKPSTSSCVSDWVEEEEEWQVLSRVMAASQQEYIDSFKQSNSKPTCSKYT